MPDFSQLAIIAALEREVRPLVKHWPEVEHEHEGRHFKFFEGPNAVLVCGGIGPVAARRATQAAIAIYQPMAVKSVGFAGALDSSLRVGDVLVPAHVVDASDGTRVDTGEGNGVLVSQGSLAGVGQKSKLAAAYGAQAVDMEAAAVARGAQARGILFSAVKAISDDYDFELPIMERFVEDGQFRSVKFVAFNAIRPWGWAKVIKVAQNSNRASDALCDHLARFLHRTKGSECAALTAAGGPKQ